MPNDTPTQPPAQNPYAQAASAYGDNAQKNTPDQRELEARVLLKSTKMLTDLQEGLDEANSELIESTLKYNRQIWMMFYDTALENPDQNRPNDLRSNIINLANFIFKREVEIMSEPTKQKFDVLININKEIAAGLMTKAKNDAENANSAASTATDEASPQQHAGISTEG